MIWWQLVMNDTDNDHLCSPRTSTATRGRKYSSTARRGAGPLGHEVTCHQWPRGQLSLPGTLCAGNRTLERTLTALKSYLVWLWMILNPIWLSKIVWPKHLTTGSWEEEWLHYIILLTFIFYQETEWFFWCLLSMPIQSFIALSDT